MTILFNRYILFAFIYLVALTLSAYKITYSYFSDSAKSESNVFTASSQFPSPPTIANHLVINEVLYDISADQHIGAESDRNRGEFLEIYNPTTSSINVTNWIIEDNTPSFNETLTDITIAPGGFLIITGATEAEFEAVWINVPDSVQFFQASGGEIGNGFANGGGKVTIKDNNGNTIDLAGWGNDITVFNPAPSVIRGHSLERDPDGKDTDAAVDFVDRITPLPGL